MFYTITCISIWWIHEYSGSDINQCHVNTLRPRQDDRNLHIISKCIFFKRLCVRSVVVDYKMKIGSGNGLALSRHQAINWVSGDPGQWCIYVSPGLIELITSPYWENISMRRKTVLFEHTKDTFTPHS